MLDNIFFLGVKNENKVTSSMTRVRLGQSMLDNIFFKNEKRTRFYSAPSYLGFISGGQF
jgi:hypothetical protein